MDLIAEKTKTRVAVRQRIGEMRPQDREAESRSICRRILEELPPAPIKICVYHAILHEVDLALLLAGLFERDDEVYLPRFVRNTLSFGRIYEDTTLLKGALGILEPPVNADEPAMAAIDIIITPGTAFDKKGGRLGRGNGGYDRWFEQLKTRNDKARLWGVAFDCQMLREVPSEPHDIRMDAVVTPREFFQIRE